MTTKQILLKVSALILAVFASITLFMSTSVIFNLFGIREKEGNYVLFVVVSNFIAGIFYLFSSYGIFSNKKWSMKFLISAAGILVIAFIGLLIHIHFGGLYEKKTVIAMIARIIITCAFTVLSWQLINKNQT